MSFGVNVRIDPKRDGRNFSKRQMTWMRKMSLEWISPQGAETIVDRVKKFLQIP